MGGQTRLGRHRQGHRDIYTQGHGDTIGPLEHKSIHGNIDWTMGTQTRPRGHRDLNIAIRTQEGNVGTNRTLETQEDCEGTSGPWGHKQDYEDTNKAMGTQQSHEDSNRAMDEIDGPSG